MFFGTFNIGLLDGFYSWFFLYFNPHLTCTCTGVDSRDTMPYRPPGLGPSRINVDADVNSEKVTFGEQKHRCTTCATQEDEENPRALKRVLHSTNYHLGIPIGSQKHGTDRTFGRTAFTWRSSPLCDILHLNHPFYPITIITPRANILILDKFFVTH